MLRQSVVTVVKDVNALLNGKWADIDINFRVDGGCTLYDAYATKQSLNIEADFILCTDGKLFFKGSVNILKPDTSSSADTGGSSGGATPSNNTGANPTGVIMEGSSGGATPGDTKPKEPKSLVTGTLYMFFDLSKVGNGQFEILAELDIIPVSKKNVW